MKIQLILIKCNGSKYNVFFFKSWDHFISVMITIKNWYYTHSILKSRRKFQARTRKSSPRQLVLRECRSILTSSFRLGADVNDILIDKILQTPVGGHSGDTNFQFSLSRDGEKV